MKLRSILLLIIMALGLAGNSHLAQASASGWEVIGPGIEYQEFRVAGPNNAFVARMQRSNPQVTLESSMALGKINNSRESISNQARRYDQAINYWGETWGNRNRVVVAINGSYVEPNTGLPDRGMFHSGWYAKRFTDNQNGSGFAWTLDRNAFIGQCVKHPAGRQLITLANGAYLPFNGINIARGTNELILYTPQYDSNTRTDNSGVELLVELSQPSIMPNPGQSIAGIIRSVRKNLGSTPIPFDHVVISGQGLDPKTPGMKLLNNAAEGEEIRIYQEIGTYAETDCKTPLDLSWSRTFASLGGDYHFLKNGKIQSYSDNLGATYRHPRTAVAFNDDYVFFIVVDGRHPGVSVGMTIEELGTFASDYLAAEEGVAEDGGGSSVMVVNGAVKNIPSDGITAPPKIEAQGGDVVYLPFIQQNGGGTVNQPDVRKVERPVVNGLLMVVVEPVEKSASLTPGDRVLTNTTTEVRLGPGTNYGVLSSVASSSAGVVLTHNLDGVKAKGAFWWKVDFGGLSGWVSEAALVRR